MKLIVLNLARKTTERELRDLFRQYGYVKSCDLVLDKDTGASKGFGFVEISKRKDAELAIKELNDRVIGGNKIRVKEAKEKKLG
ncbi:MAG: RNA-binding protein [Calditrichota bacterium]